MARAGAGEDPSVDRGRSTRSRRVVVLLALAVVCVLVLAPPLRLYLQQQRDIDGLREEIAARETRVGELQSEVDLWQEDAYVAAQARERLNFVMPGETGFVVPDPEPSAGAPADAVLGASRPDAPPQGTWYDRLWSSVEAVGAGTSDPVLDAPVVGDGSGG